MSNFQVGNINVFPDPAEAGAYYYVPRAADLQRGQDGEPALSLLATGNGGYLMLTAEWRASDDTLRHAKHEISQRQAGAGADSIKLRFAPVEIRACRLLLRSAGESREPIATSATSRVPPFAAAFSVALDAECFERACAALRGEQRVLEVEYEGALSSPVTVRGRFERSSPRLADFLRSFRATSDAGIRVALEAAVAEGLATVVVDVPTGADGDLVTELYDRVLWQAALLVPRWLEQSGEATAAEIDVAVTLVRDLRVPVVASADLATLRGPEHVKTFNRTGGNHAAS